MQIEQPWNDDRIKLDGAFIGCVTKANADYIVGLERTLQKIANGEYNNFAGNPAEWASTIAKSALGQLTPKITTDKG